MATTVSLFCAHKRLRTACIECTPNFAPPTALNDDEDDIVVARRRRTRRADRTPRTDDA